MSSGPGLTDGILVQVGAERIRKDCERSRSSRRTRAKGINFNYGSDELTHVCSTVTLRLQNGWRARKSGRSTWVTESGGARAASFHSIFLPMPQRPSLPPSAVLRWRRRSGQPAGNRKGRNSANGKTKRRYWILNCGIHFA